MKALTIATLSLAVAACGTQQPAADQQSTNATEPAAEAAAEAVGVNAALRTAAGEARGQVSATQSGSGIAIRVAASGMEPGTYAVHVHTTGRCTPPTFESAGAHWNPTERQHGRDNPQGMHQGDLPNLTIGPDGNGSQDFTVAAATVTGTTASLVDSDGAAVVVHARPDDYRTDPSGEAGDRIACGVFG